MASNYLGPNDRINVDPGETVTSGDAREIGSGADGIVVIYMDDYVSGDAATAATSGRFTVTKGTAADCAAGEKMYLDTTGNKFTSVATGNIYGGRALTAAATTGTSFELALGMV